LLEPPGRLLEQSAPGEGREERFERGWAFIGPVVDWRLVDDERVVASTDIGSSKKATAP
jgi:hypothetical protein